MNLSICIATYNGAERVERLLAGLAAAMRDEVEVIVCDDGSSQGTADALAVARSKLLPYARLLTNARNLGVVATYNVLVRASAGTRVLLLDDDVTVPPGLLGTVHGLLTTIPNVGALSWKSSGSKPGQAQAPVVGLLEPATQLAGYCMAFSRMLYDELGGFDESFHHYCGDSDFALRATLAGRPCYRVWWPLVLHEEHAAFTSSPELGRNTWIVRDTETWRRKWEKAGRFVEEEALRKLKGESAK